MYEKNVLNESDNSCENKKRVINDDKDKSIDTKKMKLNNQSM